MQCPCTEEEEEEEGGGGGGGEDMPSSPPQLNVCCQKIGVFTDLTLAN